MNDTQLAMLSTALWLIAVGSLFVLLAGWSAGASWGIGIALARGVRGWSGREGSSTPGSRGPETLPPMQIPPRGDAAIDAAPPPPVEVEELPTRRF